MTDKVTLTKAQWRVIELLFKGERVYYHDSILREYLYRYVKGSGGITFRDIIYPRTVVALRRAQVFETFRDEEGGVLQTLARLTPAGHELARRRFSTEG